MGFFSRLFRRRAPDVDPTADTAPRRAVAPGKADTLPPDADTLVVYGLDAPDAEPDGRTPSLVVLDFDPVDVRRVFEATPALARAPAPAFAARLDPPTDALRDPNSRGRLTFVRRWLAEHAPDHVGWRLEPAVTAGRGAPGG